MKKQLILLALLCSVSGLWATDDTDTDDLEQTLQQLSGRANQMRLQDPNIPGEDGLGEHQFFQALSKDGSKLGAFSYRPYARQWSVANFATAPGRVHLKCFADVGSLNKTFDVDSIKPLNKRHRPGWLMGSAAGGGLTIFAIIQSHKIAKKRATLTNELHKLEQLEERDYSQEQKIKDQLSGLQKKSLLYFVLAVLGGGFAGHAGVKGWRSRLPLQPGA